MVIPADSFKNAPHRGGSVLHSFLPPSGNFSGCPLPLTRQSPCLSFAFADRQQPLRFNHSFEERKVCATVAVLKKES